MRALKTSLFAFAAIVLSAASTRAAVISYYVAKDNQATVVFDGSTLANPNLGRLSLLFAHGDHFHGIGTYSYSGTAAAPVVLDTNANNRIPEGFSLEPPMTLQPGSGVNAGRLVSEDLGDEYSDLEIRSIQSLSGFAAGSEESILFESGAGRWRSSLGGTTIALELVSITPGLGVADSTGASIFSGAGSRFTLTPAGGDGNSFSFTPTFFTEGDALPGTYSAALRLVDLNDSNSSSGTFHFDFQVQAVPEPSTVVMAATAVVPLVLMAARRRRKLAEAAR